MERKWKFPAWVSNYIENIAVANIWIGKTPDDFHIGIEDLYFTTYLVADFWFMVEISIDEETTVQEIPGAWPGD